MAESTEKYWTKEATYVYTQVRPHSKPPKQDSA